MTFPPCKKNDAPPEFINLSDLLCGQVPTIRYDPVINTI